MGLMPVVRYAIGPDNSKIYLVVFVSLAANVGGNGCINRKGNNCTVIYFQLIVIFVSKV